MTELKKKLTEKLIKRVFNHSELIDEIITDFKESEEFKQLILSGVSGMFSEEQMEEAWTNGCGCGETRSGYFDIENYS